MQAQALPIILTPTRAQDVPAPAFVIPAGLEAIGDQLAEAYAQGIEAARNAASWTTSGNDDSDRAGRILLALEHGGDIDGLPFPDLSGEWADSPTPLSLARDIFGHEQDIDADTVDALADAWEAGRDAVLSACIEAELIAALPDPQERASNLLDYYAHTDDYAPGPNLSGTLQAVERLEASPIERAGIMQAVYLEALARAGIEIRYSSHGVRVEANAAGLHGWTKGALEALPNHGQRWPCAALACDSVDGLQVSLDARGDLVELDVVGLHYSNQDGCYYAGLDRDGCGTGDALELSSDELSAFLCDVLAVTLPINHAAWFGNVGRYLETDDARRVIADALKATG